MTKQEVLEYITTTVVSNAQYDAVDMTGEEFLYYAMVTAVENLQYDGLAEHVSYTAEGFRFIDEAGTKHEVSFAFDDENKLDIKVESTGRYDDAGIIEAVRPKRAVEAIEDEEEFDADAIEPEVELDQDMDAVPENDGTKFTVKIPFTALAQIEVIANSEEEAKELAADIMENDPDSVIVDTATIEHNLEEYEVVEGEISIHENTEDVPEYTEDDLKEMEDYDIEDEDEIDDTIESDPDDHEFTEEEQEIADSLRSKLDSWRKK